MLKRFISFLIVTMTIASPIGVAGAGVRSIEPEMALDDLASATISGSVVDMNGGIISDAKITAINDRLGIQRETLTNNAGAFEIPFLLPGIYTLTAEMRGFATLMVTGLVAQAGLNRKLTITLQPRGVAETIRVQADQSGINLTDATLTFSIGREHVERFPIVSGYQGRSVLGTLPFLLPGILPGFTSGIRGEGLIVNGARPLSNFFTIDGGDNNDYELNKAAAPFPNPDALQELTVVTNNHKANLAGANGGIFNAVIKSGTNQFHGNARYYFSNQALNAGDFFNHIKPVTGLQSLGAQLGGPVILPRIYRGRDRTHFFVDYEAYGQSYSTISQTRGLTEAERTGDFSSLLPPDPEPDRDSNARQPIDPLTGVVFPGGKIPANRIDPIARMYIERFVPLADPTRGYASTLHAGHSGYRQLITRVDHGVGDSDRLSATYNYYLRDADDPAFYLSTGTLLNRADNHGLTVRETHLFSAKTVNEVTGTLSLYKDGVQDRAPGFTGVDPQQAGFNIRPQDPSFVSLPAVDLQSRPEGGRNIFLTIGRRHYLSNYDSTKRLIAVKDDLVHSYTSHVVSLGGAIRAFFFDRRIAPENGVFSFADFNEAGTLNGLADFLLGIPMLYYQTSGVSQYQRQIAYSLYAMDDWKVRTNLSVNFGLRYELAPPVYDTRAPATVFRPGQRSRIFPLAPEGQLFSGDPDPILGTVPRGGYPADRNNLAPRFGLAYSPNFSGGPLRWLLGEGRTSIRAGLGVFYSSAHGAGLSDVASGAPYTFAVSLGRDRFLGIGELGSFSNPWGSNPNPFPIPFEERFGGWGLSILRTFDPASRSSYTYQYNLNIQRELRWSMLLEVGYVGSNSFKLERDRDLNPLIPDPDSPGLPTLRYPFYVITSQESSGRARYDSLQARLSRRFSGGLLLDASYVLSKSLDNASGPTSIKRIDIPGLSDAKPNLSDPFSWARSSFDRRHAFVASYTYYIPGFSGHRLFAHLSRGWVIGGFTQMLSGKPLEIRTSSAIFSSFSSDRPDLVGPYKQFDPRTVRTFVVNGVPSTGHFFFDPTAFAAPTDGKQGTLGRNVIDGPGFNSTSISVARRTRLFRSNEIELRADIINLFNQVNFWEPQLDLNTSTFGAVFATLNPRMMQFSLRYRF